MSINIAFTAFDILMLVATIGLLCCRLALLPRNADMALVSALQRLSAGALALLTLSSIGILVSRTLELNGGSWNQLLQDIPLAIKVTHYGHVWIYRVPALGLLWFGWLWCLHHRHQRWAAWLMFIAAAGIAFTRSETGHPADHGDFTFAVWVDWLHLIAGSVWVGSLFGMSLVIFPKLLRNGGAVIGETTATFQRLSTLSGLALAAILLTGIFTAWQELQSWNALVTSSYGRILDVKILLVGLMIYFGAHNRYAKLPHLLYAAGKPVSEKLFSRLFRLFKTNTASESGILVRSCARAVNIESLLGLCVIIAASILLHGMPPADMRPMPDMSARVSMTAPMPNQGTHSMKREYTLPATHTSDTANSDAGKLRVTRQAFTLTGLFGMTKGGLHTL